MTIVLNCEPVAVVPNSSQCCIFTAVPITSDKAAPPTNGHTLADKNVYIDEYLSSVSSPVDIVMVMLRSSG